MNFSILFDGVIKMKKITTIMLVWFVFGIVGASAAMAEKMPYYVGISAMYAMESIDTQQTKDKFTGPIEINFDNAWGIQARAGYSYNKYFTTEALLEYVYPFEAKSENNKDRLDATSLTLNGKFTCPAFKAFVPYAVLGAGVMHAYEQIKFGAATSKTRDWGLALRGGLGVDIPLANTLSLNLEAAYVGGAGKVKHVRYTALSLGIAYRF